MEHSNLPPRSEDLIAGIVQAATESLPHQPDVLAKARALFGPLLDKGLLGHSDADGKHAADDDVVDAEVKEVKKD